MNYKIHVTGSPRLIDEVYKSIRGINEKGVHCAEDAAEIDGLKFYGRGASRGSALPGSRKKGRGVGRPILKFDPKEGLSEDDACKAAESYFRLVAEERDLVDELDDLNIKPVSTPSK